MIKKTSIQAILIFSLALCTFVLCTVFSSIAQPDKNLTIEPYIFETRTGVEVDAELGKFWVPENRKANTGKRIQLAFVRFKSTNPNPGSPIVYLAGGPGGSGSGTARGSRFDLFMAMREIGDVIAFDQRGTGMSQKLPSCSKQWSYPPDKPGDREKMLQGVIAVARECAEELKSQGADLSAYNTNESADDLEDLRKVLGAQKLSLWGISYGTQLVLATIKRHESSIDRVILAGIEGPDHTIKLPSDTQTILERIDAAVKADPFASKEFPGFLGSIETVLKRLESKPVTVQAFDSRKGKKVELRISKYDVQMAATGFLRGPSQMRFLPLFFKNMLKGDFSDIAPNILRRRNSRFFAMPFAMDAASGLSDERKVRIERESKETLMASAINFPFPEINEGIGVPDVGSEFRAAVQTGVPALFISGTMDGRTPETNAIEVLKEFPNGVHLIIEGAGHSDPLFLSSQKILETMLAFMKGETISDFSIELPPIEFRLKDSLTKLVEKTVQEQGIEQAIAQYRKFKNSDQYQAEERGMNRLGYQLLQMNRTLDAIEIFKLNVDAFPNSWNVYDSLAEAYMKDGHDELAIKYYEKSVKLNPDNTNGKEILEKIRTAAK